MLSAWILSISCAGVFQTALAGGVSNISFSTLSADLGRTMYRYSFRLPPYYTLLVRSLSVLEGIALASDPNYKVSVLGQVHCTAGTGSEPNKLTTPSTACSPAAACHACSTGDSSSHPEQNWQTESDVFYT